MDVLSQTPPPADHRIHYGPGEFHFGDLRLPKARPGAKVPLVVFVHGGWWKAQYDLEYAGFLCEALKQAGIATWSMEYRRVGNPGGGWPGTFQDVAQAYDFLPRLATNFPLDVSRVVVSGHSAGGHLAFWLAGRPHLPASGPLEELQHPAVPMRGAVSLAGAVDLKLTIDLSGWFTFAHDKDEVYALMGGTPAQVPDRYRAGDPGQMVPMNVPQWLVQGTEDDQIPPDLPNRWAQQGRRIGERVVVNIIPGADHFDVVDPTSKAWPRVLAAFQAALS